MNDLVSRSTWTSDFLPGGYALLEKGGINAQGCRVGGWALPLFEARSTDQAKMV